MQMVPIPKLAHTVDCRGLFEPLQAEPVRNRLGSGLIFPEIYGCSRMRYWRRFGFYWPGADMSLTCRCRAPHRFLVGGIC